MRLSTVSWRQAVAAIAATLLTLFAVIVVVRSDGLPAVDAASARATGWFVHQPTGRVVLVDGYGGRALASLDAGFPGEQLSVAEGGPGAFVLNDTTAEARAIDSVELRLGTPFGLSALGAGSALAGVGQAGLVVVNPGDGEANVVPGDGEPISFAVEAGDATQVAPDGAIWSLVDGDLVRTTSSATQRTRLGVDGDALLSLVGNVPLLVDVTGRRARLGDGGWHTLDTAADPSEILVQVPGPPGDCGWVGADDDLWCVSANGVADTSTVAGLDLGGSDLLAIAGEAAAVVRRGPSSVVRFDWRTGRSSRTSRQLSGWTPPCRSPPPSIWCGSTTSPATSSGREPVGHPGDREGPAGHPRARRRRRHRRIRRARPERRRCRRRRSARTRGPRTRRQRDRRPTRRRRRPRDGRSGASVPVQVTVNDYDPDGEAIAVSSVGVPGHGSVDIGTATTVVYTPEPGYVGIDEFDYTIVDGNGTTASASVIIELLAPGSTNKPPVGVADAVETGAGRARDRRRTPQRRRPRT